MQARFMKIGFVSHTSFQGVKEFPLVHSIFLD